MFYELCNEDYVVGEDYGWNLDPIAYMPRLVFTADEGIEFLVRVRKSPDSRNDFYIGAYAPDEPLNLSSSSCVSSVVTIEKENGNGYRFVPLLDNNGGLIGQLFAYGEELGDLTYAVEINNGSVRQDGNGVYYLDRNYTLTAANQPSRDVDVYFHFSDADWTAFSNASQVAAIDSLYSTRATNDCGAEPSHDGIVLTQYHNYPNWGSVNGVAFSSDHLSTFYLHAGNTPLPVRLTAFEARAIDNKSALLSWNVVDEINLDGYIVERSADGRNFTEIGK